MGRPAPPRSGDAISDSSAIFDENASGLIPREFYAAFKRGEIEDTSENMTLLIQAIALGAGASNERATPASELAYAIAARARQ